MTKLRTNMISLEMGTASSSSTQSSQSKTKKKSSQSSKTKIPIQLSLSPPPIFIEVDEDTNDGSLMLEESSLISKNSNEEEKDDDEDMNINSENSYQNNPKDKGKEKHEEKRVTITSNHPQDMQDKLERNRRQLTPSSMRFSVTPLSSSRETGYNVNDKNNTNNICQTYSFSMLSASLSPQTTASLASMTSASSINNNKLTTTITSISDDDNHNPNHIRTIICDGNSNITSKDRESNIKDLIESPILNKGLSPRLNRMVMKSKFSQSSSSNNNNSNSNSNAINFDDEHPEPNSEDSDSEITVNNNDSQQKTSVITSTNSTNSSNDIISPLPPTSSCWLGGSARAMAILKAASKNASKSLYESSTTYSSSDDSNSSDNNLNLTKKKTPLERSSSFQYLSSPSSSLLSSQSIQCSSTSTSSSYSRGSAFLKALQNQLNSNLSESTKSLLTTSATTSVSPPVTEHNNKDHMVSLSEGSTLSSLKTACQQESSEPPPADTPPSKSILKSPSNSSLTQKKKKTVLFTEPVVSNKLYFDSTSSTLKSTPLNDNSTINEFTSSSQGQVNTSPKSSIKRKELDITTICVNNLSSDSRIPDQVSAVETEKEDSLSTPSKKFRSDEKTWINDENNKSSNLESNKVDGFFQIRSRKIVKKCRKNQNIFEKDIIVETAVTSNDSITKNPNGKDDPATKSNFTDKTLNDIKTHSDSDVMIIDEENPLSSATILVSNLDVAQENEEDSSDLSANSDDSIELVYSSIKDQDNQEIPSTISIKDITKKEQQDKDQTTAGWVQHVDPPCPSDKDILNTKPNNKSTIQIEDVSCKFTNLVSSLNNSEDSGVEIVPIVESSTTDTETLAQTQTELIELAEIYIDTDDEVEESESNDVEMVETENFQKAEQQQQHSSLESMAEVVLSDMDMRTFNMNKKSKDQQECPSLTTTIEALVEDTANTESQGISVMSIIKDNNDSQKQEKDQDKSKENENISSEVSIFDDSTESKFPKSLIPVYTEKFNIHPDCDQISIELLKFPQDEKSCSSIATVEESSQENEKRNNPEANTSSSLKNKQNEPIDYSISSSLSSSSDQLILQKSMNSTSCWSRSMVMLKAVNNFDNKTSSFQTNDLNSMNSISNSVRLSSESTSLTFLPNNSTMTSSRASAMIQAAKENFPKSFEDQKQLIPLMESSGSNNKSSSPTNTVAKSRKSILRLPSNEKNSSTLVKKKRVIFSEPVVSCELVFDRSSPTLNPNFQNNRKRPMSSCLATESIFESNQVYPNLSLSMKETIPEEAHTKLDLTSISMKPVTSKLDSRISNNNESNSDGASEWTTSSPQTKRRKLCHQKTTLEDCDEDLTQQSDYNNHMTNLQLSALGHCTYGQNGENDDEDDEDEDVYFSMSKCDARFDGDISDNNNDNSKLDNIRSYNSNLKSKVEDKTSNTGNDNNGNDQKPTSTTANISPQTSSEESCSNDENPHRSNTAIDDDHNSKSNAELQSQQSGGGSASSIESGESSIIQLEFYTQNQFQPLRTNSEEKEQTLFEETERFFDNLMFSSQDNERKSTLGFRSNETSNLYSFQQTMVIDDSVDNNKKVNDEENDGNNKYINQESEDNDEMVNLQIPLKLAQKFSDYLLKYLQAHGKNNKNSTKIKDESKLPLKS